MSRPIEHTLTAKEKAQVTNRDLETYGSFAEIGAGQEVARWFFKAGLASKTVAKTMSAYDMTFSDAIYGREESGRYVCESRLNKMLSKEYRLLEERLGEERGSTTRFFAFANTVAAKSRSVAQGHGWVGVRFQGKPGEEASEIVIHVNLTDPRNFMQQEAMGIVGVNLLYGALYLYDKPEELIASLADDVGVDRIEIDMIKMSGPAFKGLDNRLMSLHLVKLGLARWSLFGPEKKVLQPTEVLYGKNILVQRGSFRPVTHVHVDMLEKALTHYEKDFACDQKETIVLMEITIANLKKTAHLDLKDFLDRIDLLSELGYHVLITNFDTIAELSNKLKEQKTKSRALVLGVEHLETVFKKGRYDHFEGGVMEAAGLLFGGKALVYIYPFPKTDVKGNITMWSSLNFVPDEEYSNIYNYLINEGKIKDIKKSDDTRIEFYTRDVLDLIQSGDNTWEEHVPDAVAKAIKENKLFGYDG